MTREEAIRRLGGILTEAVEFENSVCYVTEEDKEPLEMAIKALEQEPETVTEFADRCRECGKNRWIPVTERLPEKSDRYLAYIVNRHDDKLRYIMTCDYLVDGYWNWFPDSECASDNVIAWMPLPKPYKAESEDK